MTSTNIIGMDISKYSFELCGTDERGHQMLQSVCTAILFRAFSLTLPPAPLRWNRGSGSQHWARKLKEFGHQVLLIPAQHVAPYRRVALKRPQ